MPFLKAKKIREEKEKEKNIQAAEPVEMPEPIQEPESGQTLTDTVEENSGEKFEETHDPDLTHEAGEISSEENSGVEEENKNEGAPEQEEEIKEENSDSNAEDEKNENQTDKSQENKDTLPEESPKIPEDSKPKENENPDGQDTSSDGDSDNTDGNDITGGEDTGQDGDGNSGTEGSGKGGSENGGGNVDGTGGTLGGEINFDSNERYVDQVSTKTEFDKVLDSLAAISKDLLSHEVERFAKKYADKYQGKFTKAEADAKKYEAFLGGYITNAAMTLYENNYMDAAIRQLDKAKNVLIATHKLKTETSEIKERVEEEGAAVDLSDILGMFGDG